MDSWIGLIGLVMGIFSFLGGLVLWYRGAVEKSYAAQRDFGHLKNNYQSLSAAINLLAEQAEAIARDTTLGKDTTRDLYREFNELNRSFVEVKALTLAISNRLEGLAARVDSSTSGWSRRQGDG